MKKLLLSLSAMLLAIVALSQTQKNDWANFGRYEAENKTAPKGAVVFMGNSITRNWVEYRPEFFKENNYIGRGIGGQTSAQMLVRFRRDVIDLKPATVVILAGTNDIAQNNGYISLENVLGNIMSMVELAKANNIQVVLCSVLPAAEFGWRKELKPANDILQLNQMIKYYADQNKIPYVDYHTALKDENNGLPKKYAGDGVHPNVDAYKIMEELVQKSLGKKTKLKKDRKYLFSN